MRRPDLDEPMVLLDDEGRDLPPAAEAPPRRGPRREWLLLVAAAAVVIGVGLIGDDREPPVATPTTTTSAVTTTTHRRFTSTVRRYFLQTTTTMRAATPAPFTTDTAIAFQDRQGAVIVLDLDTGTRCTVDDDLHRGVGLVSSPGSGRRAILQAGPGLALVDSSCRISDVDASDGSYAIGIGDLHFWTTDQASNGGALVEHDVDTGRPTGRTFDAPPYIGPAVTSGDRLVLGLGGAITEVTRRGVRDIGPGTPIALHRNTLAIARCEQLRCRLHLIDIDSGADRTVTAPDVSIVPWAWGTFSPDGTRMLVQTHQSGDVSDRIALVELGSGAVLLLPSEYHGAVFTIDGLHVIGMHGGGADLLSLDGSESWPIDDVGDSAIVAIPGVGSY